MEKTILNTIPYKNTDRIGVIYKITNTITNNFYIGSSITPRKRLIRSKKNMKYRKNVTQ